MFTLDQVLPWGRSFDEYCRMFDLTEDELNRSIIGCGDGPASFNAEASHRGRRVISCDPLYRFEKSQIQGRIAAAFEQIVAQTRRNAHAFVWEDGIRTVEELGLVRMTATQAFVDDYELGKAQERYLDAELPTLPFADAAFDLALCSHFLFLYSSQLGEAFHRAAVRELCRVAAEVRIFPLLALGGDLSPFVAGCVQQLREAGHHVDSERPVRIPAGGNEMIRITRTVRAVQPPGGD